MHVFSSLWLKLKRHTTHLTSGHGLRLLVHAFDVVRPCILTSSIARSPGRGTEEPWRQPDTSHRIQAVQVDRVASSSNPNEIKWTKLHPSRSCIPCCFLPSGPFFQPKFLFIQFDDLICYLDFVKEFSFLWFWTVRSCVLFDSRQLQ